MREHIAKALATGLAGAVIGWAGNALALNGRVAAIEAALVRIEARLYANPTPQPLKETK